MTMTHNMEPCHAMLPPTSFQEAASHETNDGESSSLEDDFELQQRLQELAEAASDDPYMQQEPARDQTDEAVSIPTDHEAAEGVAADADGGHGHLATRSEERQERPSSAGRGRAVDVDSTSSCRRRKKDKKKKKHDKKKHKKRATSSSGRSRSPRRARSSS